jgi:hypothetical protein
MATRTLRGILLALAAAIAVGCCSTAPPKEVVIPQADAAAATIAEAVSAMKVPPRPAVPCCEAADTDAQCATKEEVARVILEGYIEQLEDLLRSLRGLPAPARPGPR